MFFFKKKIKNPIPTSTQDKSLTAPPLTRTPQPTPSPTDGAKIKKYKVTGTSHYTGNILELATENIDYDLSKKELVDEGYDNERIYQYNFYPSKTELVPEPDNPYDPNAVKVIVDDVLVGYIKAGSCTHILKVLKEDRIVKIECEIGGGNYKYLGYDEDEDKYFLEKYDSPYFVSLSITEK